MTRIIFLVIVCSGIICFGFVYSESTQIQNEKIQKSLNDSLILWNSSFKLKWDDFQGIPDKTSKYKALTFVQIALTSEQFDDSVVIEIPTYFYKNLSWSKSLNNSSLLRHEQLHFDIGELMARKIRKEYSLYVIKDLEIGYKDLKRIYRNYYGAEFDRYNRNFDEETEHGIIASKQKEWELKIAKELSELEEYSSPRVTIKR